MKQFDELQVTGYLTAGSLTVDGNVGIGTAIPNQKLEVAGNIDYQQLTRLEVDDSFAANVRCADFRIGHSTRRGTLGRALVDFQDTLVLNFGADWPYVRCNGQWSQASSRELKENIADLSSKEAFEALEGLSPVKFNLKADEGKLPCLGFIAEDAPEIIASRDRKAISNDNIITILAKVVKEQQKAISTLEKKVSKSGGGR